jgi:hypothetical protein
MQYEEFGITGELHEVVGREISELSRVSMRRSQMKNPGLLVQGPGTDM